jgi:hypothetical protein
MVGKITLPRPRKEKDKNFVWSLNIISCGPIIMAQPLTILCDNKEYRLAK